MGIFYAAFIGPEEIHAPRTAATLHIFQNTYPYFDESFETIMEAKHSHFSKAYSRIPAVVATGSGFCPHEETSAP